REVDHAVENSKRLIPIVRRDAESSLLPGAVRSINWLFFRETDDFEAAFNSLIQAIDADIDWLHAHTRLLVRALEWDRGGRDSSFVLRGRDLERAEHGLAHGGAHGEPKADTAQTQHHLATR